MPELFHERLRRLRKQHGMKLKEVGGALNMTLSAVWAWEVGVNRVHHDQIAPLAAVFGVSADYLLTGREHPAHAALLAAVRAAGPRDVRLVARLERAE